MDNHVPRQPFHEGELAVQERAGERDAAKRNGVGIAARILPGELSFLGRQRLLALTTSDHAHLWTSVACGEPGFATSADGQRLIIRPGLMTTSTDDPVQQRLAIGRDVGVLAIELASRRRLRINGAVEALSADEVRIVVRGSVGNCPKYTQRPQPGDVSTGEISRTSSESGSRIDDERREVIERADTAFVGSLHPTRGGDES